MASVFERLASMEVSSDVPLCDYKPYQLAAYVLKAYPNASIEALTNMRDNLEIGNVLYNTTFALLEGYLNDKNN